MKDHVQLIYMSADNQMKIVMKDLSIDESVMASLMSQAEEMISQIEDEPAEQFGFFIARSKA